MRSCLNRDWLVPRVVTSVQGRGLWLCTSRHRARRVPRSPRCRGPPVTPAVPVRFHTSQGPAVPCRREASAAARPRAGQGTPELTRLHYKWKRPQTRCREPPRLTDEPGPRGSRLSLCSPQTSPKSLLRWVHREHRREPTLQTRRKAGRGHQRAGGALKVFVWRQV